MAAARKYATRPERIAVRRRADQDARRTRLRRPASPRSEDPRPFRFWSRHWPGPIFLANDRRLIVPNMGRLDRSVIPALAAVLDSPDPALAADAAMVLGTIGDKEAIPFLTFTAGSSESAPPRASPRKTPSHV